MHCHRAGFGHRIENGLVRVAPGKIVSTNRWTDGHENCICTTSYTHKHYMLISEQYLQKCRSNALDNNDLVKFTSSKEDNSATNEIYRNENCTCRTVYYQ